MSSKYTLDQILRPIWKKPPCFSRQDLTANIAKWLLYPGSFTRKIQALFPGHCMRIQVLRESLEIASKMSYEHQCFSCKYIYIREIRIYLDKHLLMFARSSMPKDAMPILKRKFRGLRQQPLGHLLFGSAAILRGSFELAKITPRHLEFNWMASCQESSLSFLWGRRSIFSTHVGLLSLTEVFSPDFIRLINERENSTASMQL